MNLKNGYKVLYDVANDGERSFYASKSGKFEGADLITTVAIGEFKLVYEKDGRIYGSDSGIPAEGDYCFEDFDKVFADAKDGENNEEETPAAEPAAEPAAAEPEVEDEEEPAEGEGEGEGEDEIEE